jgi:hypothetical protein
MTTTSQLRSAGSGNTKRLACLLAETMTELLPKPNGIFPRTDESDFHIELWNDVKATVFTELTNLIATEVPAIANMLPETVTETEPEDGMFVEVTLETII